ncbi:HNH endonuclease [uncultured Vagococcus sp.]|uniref:HNH endonuclease n=1 Tax=uncultured Vagococcus sp. TaxID=189676 RepID=UPI00258623D9|nr:HNH endonuclease [uncultured Vagococcus sp.]
MGLIYSSADSAQLISALRSNIQSAKETTSQLTSGSQRIISAVDGRTLAGAAYTAGKGLFSDLIIPTISRVTNAFNQLEQDLQRYQSADGIIKGEGSYLDEDIIKRKIELKRAQKSSALTSVSTLTSQIKLANTPEMSSYIRSTQREMNRLADSLEEEIRQLQKKLEALHTFSSSTSGLFTNSLNDLKVSMQGVTVLSKTIVMNTGNYILPQGKDKSWFTEQKDIAKIEEEKFQIAKGNKKKQWVSYLSRFMYVEDPNHITPEELRFNEQYKDKLFPKEEFEGDKDLTLIIAEAIRDGIDPFTGRELDWMTKASLALFAISLVAPGKFSKGKYKAKMPSRVKVQNGKVVNSTTGKIVQNNHKLPQGSTIKNTLPSGRPKLANTTHPKTGIKFNSRGYPEFKSEYRMKLDSSDYLKSRGTHFRRANNSLYKEIQNNSNLKQKFTNQDLELLKSGKTPKGYTWHHHQDTGVMELVDAKIHKETGHSGGFSLWGPGN